MYFESKSVRACWLALFLLFVLVISENGFCQPSATQIMEQVYHRDDGDDSKAVSEMILEDKNGDRRIRELIVYTKDFPGDVIKSLTRFTSPADIAGTGFLNWDNKDKQDDQFLYLPALKRVRRIVTTQKHLRFVNSDFTYEDMERREVDRDTHQLLGTTQYKDLDCYLIRSIPKEMTNTQYGYFKSWIAKNLNIIVKTEFYDKNQDHYKTYTALALKKIDHIWTITHALLEDHKRNHKTILKLKGIEYNINLSDSYFTKNFLGSY
ncbi:MAG: outer membrane lipoprotein-sorting protein [Deltaproteobacteria bacterium]|nr:outer membrane lipoprotein-sorting protein [Deltaproteobacteria bacterium]